MNVANSHSDCSNKLMDEFTNYDQTIDVISGLEAFFNYAYKDTLTYFDRFPDMPPNGLTPDFTVLFNNNYGIIFELKRTFPNDIEGFAKEIKQLLSYDSVLHFKKNEMESRIIPNNHDIVLLISSTNSNEIFARINRFLEEKNISFENNLIFMDYSYDSADTKSKYIIKKYAGKNRQFRDTFESLSLEETLGFQAKSIKCYPSHFIKYKINEVLCNDEPPELYMVVYLWSKILYDYLLDEQKEIWRRGNIQTILDINLDIDTLLNDLNLKYIPNGNVRRSWVKNTMKFLEVAGLAIFIDETNVLIRFRNLRTKIGPEIHLLDGEDEKYKTKELGSIFIDWYCKNLITGKKPKQVKEKKLKKRKSTTLSEFKYS